MNSSATAQKIRRPDVDADWADLTPQFKVREGTTYLNHGSFGITPNKVREDRLEWIERLDCQPMDFYCRQWEEHSETALKVLGRFLNTDHTNLIFSENATSAMNVVANSFPLQAGDEVLSNNHEYGAVHRIWNRACEKADAELKISQLPDAFETHDQVVDAFFAGVTDQTRLIVVSHITSPTALIMPVKQICQRAAEQNIAVVIDGPHAPANVPLDLTDIGCAFYTASCHKWLCATLGSGFLYVHPDYQGQIQPPNKSWGRLLPAMPEKWFEEFIWPGTRDPSSYMSIVSAIEFMESVGLEAFRKRVRYMQRETTRQLIELTGKQPIGRDIELWYGTMAHVPLPDGDWSHLQMWLWKEHQIEVPIINFQDKWFVRVSHHLYVTRPMIDKLMSALKVALA